MLYVNSANFVRYLANPIANFLVKHGELKTNTYHDIYSHHIILILLLYKLEGKKIIFNGL